MKNNKSIFEKYMSLRGANSAMQNKRRSNPIGLEIASLISFARNDNKERKNTFQKDFKGFTLIELLIYMGLLSIFLVVLSQIFGSVLDAQLESQSTSAVTQDGRFILSRLSYDIHRASSITSPALGVQSTSLTLDISGSNTYSINISNGNLELVNSLGTNKLNSSETTISNLKFKRLGNIVANAKNTLQITYTVTSKVVRKGGPETKNFQTTIGIR